MSKAILRRYRVCCGGLENDIRIALLSDLHERSADDIVRLIIPEKPDIIAISGDTFERFFDCDDCGEKPKRRRSVFAGALIRTGQALNSALRNTIDRKNQPDAMNVFRVLEKCGRLAPTFISLGNHEEELLDDDLLHIKRFGAILLDNADTGITVKGQRILIGGLSCQYDEKWLESFCNNDGVKILLCHKPEFYDSLLYDKPIDLILSGHNHGGQFRMFGKGLISSSQGLFPKYDKGLYHGRLVVSAGCSNPISLPRINNPREAVIIDFVKHQTVSEC